MRPESMNLLRENLLALGLCWLRILMGLGIAYHGYGKVFGGRMDRFAEGVANMGLPLPDILAWAAVLVFATMSVAAFIRHAPDPFKVKELAVAYWTIAGALALTGPGQWSLDELFCRWSSKRRTSRIFSPKSSNR